jgi:two-component system response regulator YesN
VLFTREIGRSFTEFLAACRIDEAERLMADPTLSIKEISRLVGIENPLYFSRLFRKHTGIPPTKFRNPATRK